MSSLTAALRREPGPEVLTIGAGPFFELWWRRARPCITVCDIDERAVELAKRDARSGAGGRRRDRPGPAAAYPDARFDLVVAMDVIEHLPETLPWLRELVRVTTARRNLFLTTPKYASKSLVTIENTALELVARAQGFSRDGPPPVEARPRRFRELF